jgi:hypothetical protein
MPHYSYKQLITESRRFNCATYLTQQQFHRYSQRSRHTEYCAEFHINDISPAALKVADNLPCQTSQLRQF